MGSFSLFCRSCLKFKRKVLYLSREKVIYTLKMNLEYSRGILFVRLEGKLIRGTSYKINNYLIPVLLKHKIKYLVYNFYNLKDIDESGIDALLNTKTAIKSNKGIIYLCEVNKMLNKKIHKLKIKRTASELSAFEVIEV